ncbi:MAG TPA: sulfite oxidase, partial [Gemmataceae bacterium]|nr:sulfite oxidase [Gemmataceae bacterium]
MGGFDRRTFLRTTGLAALPLLAGRPALWADTAPAAPARITRQKDPVNLESPFAALNSFITPNNLHYIRNHYAMPELDAKEWRLKVSGAVERPLELTYAQLRELPTRTVAVTLECAGNGRAFLEPKAKGVQWELGAVSTAEWTGVPLGLVLERAGLRAGAVDVVLEGADSGVPGNEPKPPGKVTFSRGLPLAKARRPEVLLAYKMNGADLPKAHGFPARAVVGGWYGMASVKWLTRVVVTDRPFHGYDQTADYAVWEKLDGIPTLTPIGGIDVKSSISRPAAGEAVPAGKDYTVRGFAWAGEAGVAKVEVSADGGK